MKICTALLRSVSAYSPSRPHVTPKIDDKESPDEFEKRTWREKAHFDQNGRIYLPAMGFKMALDSAARFLSLKVAGKRNATYTKHFLAGVLVTDNPMIDVQKDDVEPEWLFMNADGKRGSGTRVWRCFPLVREWSAEVTYYVADETIGKDIFERHLVESGKFIGIGRFRPEKGGFKGRYEVVKTAWA